MTALWNLILTWFAPVSNAVKHFVNAAELIRVIVTALAAGGGLLGVLEAIQAGLGAIWIDPATAALVTFLLTTAIEWVRRYYQGPAQALVVEGEVLPAYVPLDYLTSKPTPAPGASVMIRGQTYKPVD